VEEFVYLGSLIQSPQQLKALLTSHVVISSRMQLCRTWTVGYGKNASIVRLQLGGYGDS